MTGAETPRRGGFLLNTGKEQERGGIADMFTLRLRESKAPNACPFVAIAETGLEIGSKVAGKRVSWLMWN